NRSAWHEFAHRSNVTVADTTDPTGPLDNDTLAGMPNGAVHCDATQGVFFLVRLKITPAASGAAFAQIKKWSAVLGEWLAEAALGFTVAADPTTGLGTQMIPIDALGLPSYVQVLSIPANGRVDVVAVKAD